MRDLVTTHGWCVELYLILRYSNALFTLVKIKGTRNCILGTGVEINYGIFRASWTFARSYQFFYNFYNCVLAQQ